MASGTVKEFAQAWWAEVNNRVIGAVVFLDDASAECLHWDGGLFNLTDSGAVAVRSLSSQVCRKGEKKAVFVTQANSEQLHMMSEIIRHSDLTHCILIPTVSLDIIYSEVNEGRDVSDVIASGRASTEATKQLEMMLIGWMGKKQSSVEVVHIPIFTISLTNVVFVTPPYHHVYPLFNGKLVAETPAVDLHSLSIEERAQARRLASGLNSMLDSMNLKEDVFYMGTYSGLIAGILENSPISLARRKNCLHPASLIIVDRSLDVAGVTSYSTEAVLDKILSTLPRFPGHHTEVAVDMSPLCKTQVTTDPVDGPLSPGCLYHPDNDACLQTYDYMINKSYKEVMNDLYTNLFKIDEEKAAVPSSLMKVTPQSVENIVATFKGKYEVIMKHIGVLQQALAMMQTLRSPLRQQQELFNIFEAQTLQNLGVSRESTSVLLQICNLIKKRKERKMPLENYLALITTLYSLIGTEITFSKPHEDALAETLGVAIFEDHKILLQNTLELGQMLTPEDCDATAKRVLKQWKAISLMRRWMYKYNSVLKPGESGVGYEYRGVLQQLVDDMVDSNRPELPDLKYRNDSIKNLLRSGLDILTSKKGRNTKHPLDNPTVIIFVVGGITAEECKGIHRSVITSGIDNTVLIGSTKMATPHGAMRDVLPL